MFPARSPLSFQRAFHVINGSFTSRCLTMPRLRQSTLSAALRFVSIDRPIPVQRIHRLIPAQRIIPIQRILRSSRSFGPSMFNGSFGPPLFNGTTSTDLLGHRLFTSNDNLIGSLFFLPWMLNITEQKRFQQRTRCSCIRASATFVGGTTVAHRRG